MTSILTKFLTKTEPRRGLAFTLLEMLIVIAVIGILLGLTVPAVTSIIQSSRLSAAGDQVLSLFSMAQQIASVEGRAVEIRFVKNLMPGGIVNPNFADGHYQTVLLLRNYQPGEMLPTGVQVPLPTTGSSSMPSYSVLAADPVQLPKGIVISDNPTLNASSVMTSKNPVLTYPPTDATKSQMQIYKGGQMVPLTSGNSPFLAATTKQFCSIFIRADGTSLPQLSLDGSNTILKWCITLVDEKTEENAADFNSAPVTGVNNFYCIQIDPINGHATFYRP